MAFEPPPYDPYRIPQPPRPKQPGALIIVLVLVGAAFWVTMAALVISDTDDKETGTPPPASSAPPISVIPDTPETTAATDSDADQDMTELVTDLAWDEMNESEKDDMCISIEWLGPDWAADAMRDSQSGETDDYGDWEIDWDLAAEHIADKCTERGF